MFNMMNIVKDVQKKLGEVDELLAKSIIMGEAGGGLVKVKMSGKKILSEINIDNSIDNDIEMIKDLIIAAVNNASIKADEKKAELIKENASDTLPNIPGLDLGNIFNG